MAFLSNAQWQLYRDIINEFHEDANQESVIWKRHDNVLQRYGEDKLGGPVYTDTPILALVQDNFFRSWPISDATVSGKIDKESIMLYLNTQYLSDNGWTNANDQFKFDPGKDYFVVNGLTYKCFGEIQTAQAKDKTLFTLVILKREELATSTEKYA